MTKPQLYLATRHGLLICTDVDGAWGVVEKTLEGRALTSVIAREGVILVGTRDGVLRSDDRGRSWRDASRGLTARYVRWMAYHPDISDFELAGVEPAAIFVSLDGAESWRECAEVAELRERYHWFLPYSPGAGCVRGFASHGLRAYAAVEVGGALRSEDGGETWALCPGSTGAPHMAGPPPPAVHPDVHSIAVHPSSPDLVFAPTGGGFYGSRDGGASWRLVYSCYARAVWLDPADPRHIVLGPANGVDRGGRIEESRDGGDTWSAASGGLATPWPHHMVERFAQVDGELFAVLSNGQLLVTSLPQMSWHEPFPGVRDVNAVASMVE